MDRAKYITIRKLISQESPLFFNSFFQIAYSYCLFGLAVMPWINSEFPWILKILSPFILAMGMYRSFSLFHDGTHNSLHKNKICNDVLALLVSPLCLLPFDAWKASHLQHHQWSGNIEHDPVMGFIKIHPKLSPSFRRFLDFMWTNWLPVLAFIQHIVFWTLSITSTFKKKLTLRSLFSLALPFLFWCTLIWFTPVRMFFGLVAPGLFIYLLGTEIINLPHHLQLNYRYGDSKLPAWEQHQTARSCIYPAWISDFVVLNFNYHVEHHLFPDLPWYKLSDVHHLIVRELNEKYVSENNFSWIKEARKLTMSEVLASQEKIHSEIEAVS